MGVITKDKSMVQTPIKLEENFQNYVFSSDEEISAPESDIVPIAPIVVSPPTTPRRRRDKKPAVRSGLVPMDGLYLEPGRNMKTGRRQGPGSRKQRRMEHAKELTSFIDPEDLCEDFSDTLPDTVTAFTKLFMEKENMEIWNDFIEKSEIEQEAYLRQPRRKGKKNRCQSEGEGNVLGGRGSDQRTAHPAFSGEACFRRVDAKLRDLLKHKHLPMGKLENLENELVDFFLTSSDGVWINIMEDPFDRLLLHSIAQYMSLKSKSYDSKGGTGSEKRETHVENPKPFFVPPREKLVAFLERSKPAEKS